MKKIRISTRAKDMVNAFDRFLIFIFLVTTAYVRIIDNNTMVLAVCSACLTISGLWNMFQIVRNRELGILATIGLYVFFWFIEVLGRPVWMYEFRFLISSIAYFGIAYSFMTNRRKVLPYAILYYAVAAYLIVQIAILGVPYNQIMQEKSSYNYISILALFYLLIMNYVQMKQGRELSYIAGAVFLVVAVLSYGRGGILTAVIYLAALLLAKGIAHKRKMKTYVIGALVVLALIVLGRIIYLKLLEQGYLDKFLKYGMDDNGRSVVWSKFFRTCEGSLWSVLMGGDPRTLEYLEYNVHNSFLQMYASFGLALSVIIMGLFIVRTFQFGARKNVWMLVIILGFFARAMTDKLMYRGYHEILFYIFLFEGHIRKKGWQNSPLKLDGC